MLLCPGLASGLDITTTGPSSIEKASGQSVKLDCQFTLAAEDSGPLDIEWSLLSSDNQKEDKVVRLDFLTNTENSLNTERADEEFLF